MILTITGTHQQPFNRLIEAVAALRTEEPRIYQTGHSVLRPGGECHDFLTYDATVKLMYEARVIICHAGTGTVMSVLSAGKRPVVAPRLKRFGEHVDDHQLELVQELAAAGLIVPFMSGDNLEACIEQATAQPPRPISPAPQLVAHLHAVLAAAAHK